MKKLIFLLALVACVNSAMAQMILPEESVSIDREARAHCQMIVDNINAMPLTCDTLNVARRIYHDESGRPRKYVHQFDTNDGAHDNINLSAYYDECGKLVYLHANVGSHVEETHESYYVHEGKIVDFIWIYGLMDDLLEDEDREEYLKEHRPVVGTTLTRLIGWFGQLGLENFIEIDKLLSILRLNGDEYEENMEYRRLEPS